MSSSVAPVGGVGGSSAIFRRIAFTNPRSRGVARSTDSDTAACRGIRMNSSWYAPSRSAARAPGLILATDRDARWPIARSSPGMCRSVPRASSVASARSRGARRERSRSAGRTRVEYASSSVTRRTVSTATERAVVMIRAARRPDRARRAPNRRPASDASRPPRPRAGSTVPEPAATTTPSRSTRMIGSRPALRRSGLDGSKDLEVLSPEPRGRARVRGERTDTSHELVGGPRPIDHTVDGPELGCERRDAFLRARRRLGPRPDPGAARATISAPIPARRAPSEPASSSDLIGSSRRASTGPVSKPSSICISVTPVTGSPARIACWTGLAPRQRGSSEKMHVHGAQPRSIEHARSTAARHRRRRSKRRATAHAAVQGIRRHGSSPAPRAEARASAPRRRRRSRSASSLDRRDAVGSSRRGPRRRPRSARAGRASGPTRCRCRGTPRERARSPAIPRRRCGACGARRDPARCDGAPPGPPSGPLRPDGR